MKNKFNFNKNNDIFPLFKDQLKGQPADLDFSDSNQDMSKLDPDDQIAFEEYVQKELNKQNSTWGVAGYLESRRSLLRNIPHMINENRFYHLGTDIIVPKGTRLYAPYNSKVYHVAYETEKGSYGNFVVLEHKVNLLKENLFYSLYGHLSGAALPKMGQIFEQGEAFATIGDINENGFWFEHLHLQAITEIGLKEGFISKGYCREDQLSVIEKYCPDPNIFLKIYL